MGRRWPLLPLGLLCSATRVGWVQSGVLQKIVKIVKQAKSKKVSRQLSYLHTRNTYCMQ